MPHHRISNPFERRVHTNIRVSSFSNFDGRHNFARTLPTLDPRTAAENATRREQIADELANKIRQKKRARLTETNVGDAADNNVHETVGGALPSSHSPAGARNAMPSDSTLSVYLGNDAGEELQRCTAEVPCRLPCDGVHDMFPFQEEADAEDCPDSWDDAAADDADEGSTCQILELRRRMGNVLSWDRLLAFLCIAGPTRLTASQYMLFAAALKTANEHVRMRTYKTVRGNMWKHMLNHSFPKSSLVHISDVARYPDRADTSPKYNTENAGLKDAPECVRVILPSEWAKLDVSMYNFYSEVFEHPQRDNTDHLSIERCRLVTNKAAAVGAQLTMWAMYKDAILECSTGDEVSIPCATQPNSGVISVLDQGWQLLPDGNSTQRVLVRGIFAGMWCVSTHGTEGHVQDPDHDCSTEEKLVHNALRTSQARLQDPDTTRKEPAGKQSRGGTAISKKKKRITHAKTTTILDGDVLVHPGDVCVIIRPVRPCEQTRSVCLLIGSMISMVSGNAAERLVWIDTTTMETDPTNMSQVESVNVVGLPRLHGRRQDGCNGPRYRAAGTNKGFLHSGDRYVVYRMALYADGFKQHKSLSDTRSVGGVYMLPLGLTAESRRSTASVRVLTLAPSSQSLNDVMSVVIDDLAAASSKGVMGTDPYGRRVHIFIDPVAFFGDYPAAAATADVIGHTGNVFCTHCTIPRRRNTTLSEIVYTSDVHSRRLGFMRFDERMQLLRALNLPVRTKKSLGMKSATEQDACKLPGLKLSHRLMSATKPPKSDAGVQVLDPVFDSSLSAAAVPDHLLTGLSKNVLHLCFQELSDDTERARVELMIISAATENGLPIQGGFIRWEKSGAWNGMVSVTMSTVFCLLLTAVPVFDAVYAESGDRVFLLPRKLQSLVARAYHWPVKAVDGHKLYLSMRGDDDVVYHGDVNRLCREFIRLAAAVIRDKGDRAKVIDKPNAHRAVELCVHTISNFGHARNCSEMVLEMYHRVFKEWLEKNTHADSHITAVERAIGKDWLGRVYCLYMSWMHGEETERQCAEFGLQRLLLGVSGLNVDHTTTGGAELLAEFRKLLRESFRDPVLSQLRGCGHAAQSWGRLHTWEVANKMDTTAASMTAVEYARSILPLHYRDTRGVQDWSFDVYRRARYLSVEKYDGRRSGYAHHSVERGCAISVIVDVQDAGECVVVVNNEGDGVRTFFAVLCIVKGQDTAVWCVVQQLTPDGSFYKVQDCVLRVVEFGLGVRRVGLIHACDEGCTISRPAKIVRHTASVVDGGKYTVLTRVDGYPPHLG